jgi:hypothetical protein
MGIENYIHNLYSSSNISVTRPRMMRWAIHVARMGVMRNQWDVIL